MQSKALSKLLAHGTMWLPHNKTIACIYLIIVEINDKLTTRCKKKKTQRLFGDALNIKTDSLTVHLMSVNLQLNKAGVQTLF